MGEIGRDLHQFAAARDVEVPLNRRDREDTPVCVLELFARFLGGHSSGLEHENAGDDLKAIQNAVLHLFQQHLFLPQQIVGLRLKVRSFSLDEPPLCHVLKADKYPAIVRLACRTDMKKQNATSNSCEFMANFEALTGTSFE